VDENNAQVEGFELSRTASQPTIRLDNVTQISHRDATVSGSQEASNPAGKGSEMAHQMAMKSKVLKSDIEKIMSGRQAKVAGNDSSPTARKTEAVAHWIARAVDKNSVAGAAVVGVTTSLPTIATGAFSAVAAADRVPMTEKLLGDAMQRSYELGASPS